MNLVGQTTWHSQCALTPTKYEIIYYCFNSYLRTIREGWRARKP